ncbi:helix-turn-helix domain-containing protein [Litchfieldella anticariensis]|nr:helix-turn-helix transcriptional regulator [Halomonas anticariensis]
MAEFAQGMGERLGLERERLALTSEETATRAGISETRLAVLEQGEDPGGADAVELAGLASVGVDVTFLLTGQRVLAQDERELVENYRASSPEQKKRPATTGHAVEKS